MLFETALITLLEPQSRFGGKPLKLQAVCPQTGTAVLKGLTAATEGSPHGARVNPLSTAVPFRGETSHIPNSLSPKRDCGPKRVIYVWSTEQRLVRDQL